LEKRRLGGVSTTQPTLFSGTAEEYHQPMDTDHEDIKALLTEIHTEQKAQREIIEDMQKSFRSTKTLSRTKLIGYIVAMIFLGSAVYIYYSTIVSMFG
jgi:hypothetical protein